MDEICVKRRIAAEFVKPFRLGGENDAADAEVIAVTARQPTMHFVLLNRTRRLLAEFGVVIARSADGSGANRWRGRYFSYR